MDYYLYNTITWTKMQFQCYKTSKSDRLYLQEKSVAPDECIVFRQLRERKGGAGPAGLGEVMVDDGRLGKIMILRIFLLLKVLKPSRLGFSAAFPG